MNQEIEEILLENGAAMVGFAKIDALYSNIDLNATRSEDLVAEPIIPHYSYGISITLALSKDVITNIHNANYYSATYNSDIQ